MTDIPGLGTIPDRWTALSARRVLVRQNRRVGPNDETVTAFRDGQVTLRRLRRLEGFTEAFQEIGYHGCKAGDLAVHSMDGFAGAIGVAEADGKVSPVVHLYRAADGETDLRFIAYVLRQVAFSGYVLSLAKGIRERSSSFDPAMLADVMLPIPPVDEQQRIADFLDDQVVRLDRLVELRISQKALLAEKGLSDLSQDLAAPATADRPSSKPYRWLAEGTLPLVKLGYVCDLQSGVTVDAGRATGSTYPYLRVANVQDGWVSLDEIKTIMVPPIQAARSRLQAGDVLMTEGGDLDKLGRGTVWHGQVEDCLHQNHIFALRPHVELLLPEFLALITRTHHARCYFESTGSQTTNLASTNSTKIMAFRFPLPSLASQTSLVKLHQGRLDRQARATGLMDHQIVLLRERKQALITAAVTGQFDVTTARSVA